MLRKKKVIPPADMILNIINDEPHAGEIVLKFYDSYILEASKEYCYGVKGERIGHYVNDDLAQNIRLAVYNSLPALRKAFYKKFFIASPVIVVIAKESKK